MSYGTLLKDPASLARGQEVIDAYAQGTLAWREYADELSWESPMSDFHEAVLAKVEGMTKRDLTDADYSELGKAVVAAKQVQEQRDAELDEGLEDQMFQEMLDPARQLVSSYIGREVVVRVKRGVYAPITRLGGIGLHFTHPRTIGGFIQEPSSYYPQIEIKKNRAAERPDYLVHLLRSERVAVDLAIGD